MPVFIPRIYSQLPGRSGGCRIRICSFFRKFSSRATWQAVSGLSPVIITTCKFGNFGEFQEFPVQFQPGFKAGIPPEVQSHRMFPNPGFYTRIFLFSTWNFPVFIWNFPSFQPGIFLFSIWDFPCFPFGVFPVFSLGFPNFLPQIFPVFSLEFSQFSSWSFPCFLLKIFRIFSLEIPSFPPGIFPIFGLKSPQFSA